MGSQSPSVPDVKVAFSVTKHSLTTGNIVTQSCIVIMYYSLCWTDRLKKEICPKETQTSVGKKKRHVCKYLNKIIEKYKSY